MQGGAARGDSRAMAHRLARARSPCLSPVSMMAGAELVSPVVAASGPSRDGGGEAIRDSKSERRRAIVIARGGNL